MSAAGDMLSQFVREKHISLETYRKTGEAVRTPVWFIEENGELLVRTDSSTGKIKRIRNNPRVRIAPCNARGTVKGRWVDGEARMIESESSEHVFSLLRKKYGVSYRIVRFVQRFSRSKAHPIGLAIRIGT
ncbi:PPOX class F420-dependent oxidoreductase [Candidatus Bathyarchaeota archaeon]|nr:MAG: PPOX class F420-dependent oxidoreductase [Candidatus Bathyarchaeota archaeon]TMI52756.1 MAG: PPOX class F420-dependent oxidoreductase [Candidatus Bathyarchaeota archaeon]